MVAWPKYYTWIVTTSLIGLAIPIIWDRENIFSSFQQQSSGQETLAPLILLSKLYTSSGALCLDGSPPGYYLKRGSGDGLSKWIIFLEGGGWCLNDKQCKWRAQSRLGSSKHWPRIFPLEGMFSGIKDYNPEFYSWNAVFVKYCDGGSFSGDVEDPILDTHAFFGSKKPIYYRGARIFKAVIDDLMEARGLNSSSHVLLGGCSAGGVAALINCANLGKRLPKDVIFKCLSDGGMFLDTADIAGNLTSRSRFQTVVNLQNVQMNSNCTQARPVADSWQCFFPEHIIQHLDYPVFFLNSLYDTWQIGNVFVPLSADVDQLWNQCRSYQHPSCSADQLKVLHSYSQELKTKLSPVLNSESGGVYLDSCLIHCQAQWTNSWHVNRTPVLRNANSSTGRTIAEVVADWFFERNNSKYVDCPYPCNPTCPIF